MSIITDITNQYNLADAVFAQAVQNAFQQDNDAAFDLANLQSQRNDQAYFLYLFTRFEKVVNEAVETLIANRRSPPALWPEYRIWDAWRKTKLKDIPFKSRVEVLIDKSNQDYAFVVELYDARNEIAHGENWTSAQVISVVSQRLENVIQSFNMT